MLSIRQAPQCDLEFVRNEMYFGIMYLAGWESLRCIYSASFDAGIFHSGDLYSALWMGN